MCVCEKNKEHREREREHDCETGTAKATKPKQSSPVFTGTIAKCYHFSVILGKISLLTMGEREEERRVMLGFLANQDEDTTTPMTFFTKG